MASRGGTPQGSRRGSESAPTDVSGGSPKKFLNGWTKEQERLMAEWADIAGCYRWLHDKSEKIYSGSNMWITIPVIILSTLTGTANFAVDSFIPQGQDEMKKYVAAGIGGLSIFAGILTTLGNFFQFAQKSEAHRVAGVAWGKFQRQLTVELAIHPDDRIEALDFLKICRQDLDRMIEQSPAIPDSVIAAFETEFKDIEGLKKPDICHGIEHTRVYDATKPRLGKITAEAALYLKQRKKLLRDDILPDFEKHVQTELSTRIEERIKTLVAAATPVPAAAAPTTPQPAEDVSSIVTSLETDWRKLLVGRKHLLTDAASMSQTFPQAIQATRTPTSPLEPDQIRLNIVGEDGPPSESSSEVGSSVSRGPAASAPTPSPPPAPPPEPPRPSSPPSTEVDFP